MASKSTQRRLTAILSADVVGYSRLMGADEESTIETLTAYRKVFTTKIKKHRGRVVDAKGDAILAEFASVVDAVNGAVKIQRELAEQNADLTHDRRMDFRIGINMGDVVVKDDVIYGDGVNVAARLEALAEPGGICISRHVYDHVKQKLKLQFEYMGEQKVKNIEEPVRAYSVNLAQSESDRQDVQPNADSVHPFMPAGVSLELPVNPSIAVLAFENMSGDAEQDYFSDGITEDIITDLSKISNLFVIARNASFTYKGRSVNPKQVAEELGVRYVLEGSVRKAGGRVRITAQLIEAATGSHLWAERYDRELEDIFALQDEITAEIVTALHVKLIKGEQARIRRNSLGNPKARDLFYRGIENFNSLTKEGMLESRKLNEEVIRLEPDSPTGYMGMAQAHFFDALRGWSDDRAQSQDSAMEWVQKAIALDENDGWAHALKGCLLVLNGEHNQALASSERAIVLAPNYADVVAWVGWVLFFSSHYEEGISATRRAIRLCPVSPAWYLTILSIELYQSGQYEEAIALCTRAITLEPDYATPHFLLAINCSALGRYEEARKAAESFRRVSPQTPHLQEYANRFPFKDPAENENFMKILRKAGLK